MYDGLEYTEVHVTPKVITHADGSKEIVMAREETKKVIEIEADVAKLSKALKNAETNLEALKAGIVYKGLSAGDDNGR